MKKNYLKAMAVVPLAAVLVSCGRASIDPNDYLEVEFDGLDTVATATYHIDYEQMVMDNLKAFGIEDEDDEHDIERAAEKLKKYLGGSLDKMSKLSNGDTIIFEWEDDDVEKLEKKYKIKLKISDKEIEVTDLEEATEFDPFDYITLEYSGVSPDASVKVKVDSSFPVSYDYFSLSSSYGVSNGDKITVNFGYSDEEEYTKERCFDEGYIPTTLEKEFTVEGVQSYVTKLSEIDKASYDKMDKYARGKFDELVETWTKKEFKDIELLGANFYLPEEDAYWGKNALCYVYKVTVKKPDSLKEEEKKEEETTEAASEAEKTTEAEKATEAATEAKNDEKTTEAADEKKEEATTEAKKDEKKEDKKADDDSFVYYYFTTFENVVTPDNDKDSEYPANSVVVPDYYQFFGSISGDAFEKGDVLFEGYETLEQLYDAIESNYYSSKKETNIKK